MSEERFALPGFQLPDAPKEKARSFGEVATPFEVVFLKGVPLDEPLRHFYFYISLDAGSDIDLMAYSKTNRYVVVRDCPEGGKEYLIRLEPDELYILPGVFTLRVLENNVEIFKTIVNVRNRPLPGCPPAPCYPPGC